jgi:hypothetical protein
VVVDPHGLMQSNFRAEYRITINGTAPLHNKQWKAMRHFNVANHGDAGSE